MEQLNKFPMCQKRFYNHQLHPTTTKYLLATYLSLQLKMTSKKSSKKHDLNPLQITIVRNPGGQPKGFGFVEFSSEEEVAHAIQKVNLAILHGREIKVQPSK